MRAVPAKLNIGGTNSRIFDAVRCEYATVSKFKGALFNLLILNNYLNFDANGSTNPEVGNLILFKINKLGYGDAGIFF